ncbi:MAG: 30S ribosomal protein S6 [Epulopiscium sp.]|nr:30S ribosomal protein S6 [Candidatus Epulonipiscium sp.]
MNKYELSVVLVPTLDEESKASELERIQKYITRFGGTMDNIDDWGKRKLAYEIDKINEGFYYFIYFTADANAPEEIESRIRIMDSVLRYMFIKQED